MNIQHTFSSLNSNQKNLYIVSTPIGNLDDITLRAIKTLNEVSLIFCEDTRVTIKLLNHLHIQKPLISFYEHNTSFRLQTINQCFEQHHNIALVTDAGTPLISDPGLPLVQYCLNNSINVIWVPGPSAFLGGLCYSGFDTSKFVFMGFVPRSLVGLKKVVDELANFVGCIIFYESPLRIKITLQRMHELFGNVKVSIARELTKLYETIYYSSLSEAIDFTFDTRGEYVIVIEKASILTPKKDPIVYYYELVASGVDSKNALLQTAKIFNIAKNVLYKQIKC